MSSLSRSCSRSWKVGPFFRLHLDPIISRTGFITPYKPMGGGDGGSYGGRSVVQSFKYSFFDELVIRSFSRSRELTVWSKRPYGQLPIYKRILLKANLLSTFLCKTAFKIKSQ